MEHHEGGGQNGKYIFELVTPNIPNVVPLVISFSKSGVLDPSYSQKYFPYPALLCGFQILRVSVAGVYPATCFRQPVTLTTYQVWNDEYQKNLAVYRVKTAAYKAGQPVPSDEEAQRLVEAGKVPPAIIEEPVEAEEEEEEDDEEEEESSPEPVKAPSPPKSKRRKTSEKVAPVVEPAPAPAVKASPKKEKSSKKAKKEATPPPAPAATASEKKKKSKKTA